jgi:heat shock protein HslJ
VTISRIASTQQACSPERMRAEDAYFAALRRVRSVDLDDAYNARWLVLDRTGGPRLSFDAITARDLLIGSWEITDVSRGDAIESPVAGTDPVIAFTADGDVVIEAGCNSIRGTFDLEGDRIEVGALGQTMKACDPAELMDQETALARALESAARVEVVPGELTLVDDDGRILIVATERASRRAAGG